MIDYKHVPAPDRIPGEPGWEWARRYAARFDPADLKRIVLAGLKARRREVRKGCRTRPLWGYVMASAGMGSTVASALVERFRDERALARVEKMLADDPEGWRRAVAMRIEARRSKAYAAAIEATLAAIRDRIAELRAGDGAAMGGSSGT